MRRLKFYLPFKKELGKASLQNSDTAFDTPLIVVVIMIVTFGLIMVYDSSVVHAFKDFGDRYFYIKQQLIWALLGFASLIFFTFFDYHHLKRLSIPIFLASFVMLLAVFIPGFGVEAGGAHRWLNLGFFTVQPAEIIKLTSIIFFSTIFIKKVNNLFFLTSVIVVVIVLGLLQRDLGSTIVFFLSLFSLYLIAGAKLVYLLIFIPASFIGFLYFVLSSPYRIKRVLAFIDPFSDPQGFSYHISQILIALGTGGWLGLGLGQSRQKFEYIPEVTTDSIFAIVGEELGFFGSVFLISLLSFLVYRGFKIAEKSNDQFGKLLASGLTCWLGIQTVINLAAIVSLIPLTGVPLPFISYGGSALLVNMVAVGILLNISRNSS